MKNIVVLSFLAFSFIVNVADAQNIYTIAGITSPGYSGDGGDATLCELQYPSGIFMTTSGELLIADGGNNVVRKIDATGTITTISGNGSSGYSGDGGGATLAQLNGPSDIAQDKFGNLYIADYGNRRIRKVNSTGTITTIAGTGTSGYTGDGSAAISAQIGLPTGITVDTAGNVYFADYEYSVIRKIDLGGVITTVAGTGSAGYSGDGGSATAAKLNSPTDIIVDSQFNLFIVDQLNHRIRKVTSSGTITSFAGNGTSGFGGDGGPATTASLRAPTGITLFSGTVFIADQNNQRIRKVDASGTISTIAGNGTAGYGGDGGLAIAAKLNLPSSVACDTFGNVYISDAFNNAIRKVKFNITAITRIGANKQIQIYPNPTTGLLCINNIQRPMLYQICTLMGTVVRDGSLASTTNSIDVEALPNGVYYIKLKDYQTPMLVSYFIKQ